MLLEDICLKLYLWPFLSHLAYLKGFCSRTPLTSTPFPFITLPPGVTLGTTRTTTSSTTTTPLPTFVPLPTTTTTTAPPTFQPTVPTTTTTVPTFPPTLPTTTTAQATIPTFQPTVPTIPPTTTTTATTITTTTARPTLPPIPSTICPIFPVICLPGGQTPNPPCPCIDPRQYIFGQSPSANLRSGEDKIVEIFYINQLATGSGDDKFKMYLSSTEFQQDQLITGNILFAANRCQGLDNQAGVCINIAGCSYLIEEFYYQLGKQSSPLSFDQFLSRSMCGFDGISFLICCPLRGQAVVEPSSGREASVSLFYFSQLGDTDSPASITPGTIPTSVPSNPPVPTSRQYNLPKSEEDECGVSNATQTRVVGGLDAKPGAYPWIAALGYNGGSSAQPKYLCGGSLITTRHVLTSAHCVTDELYVVRLGTNDLSVKSSEVVDELIEIAIVHESFDRRTVKNDIALLKLKNDVPFANIRPICLPLSATLRSMDFVGMNPFVAGWGAVLFQGPATDILQDAQLPVISLQECEKDYQKRFPTLMLDRSVLCAGGGAVDACQGDSGGPLMFPHVSGERRSFHYFQIGIVSFGFECARSGFPGIYTRVTEYIPWIEQNINK